MVDKDELDQFGEAVEKKKAESKAASEQEGEQTPGGSPVEGDKSEPTDRGRPQNTADRWNQ